MSARILSHDLLKRYLRAIGDPERKGEEIAKRHVEDAIDRISHWMGVGSEEFSARLALCAAADDALREASEIAVHDGTPAYITSDPRAIRVLTGFAHAQLRRAGIDPVAWENAREVAS